MSPKLLRVIPAVLSLLVCSCGRQEDADGRANLKSDISSLKTEISSLRNDIQNGLTERKRAEEVNARLTALTAELEELKKTIVANKARVSPRGSDPAPPSNPFPKEDLPYGIRVVGKPAMIYSPYAPEAGKVDVVGLKQNTKVKCPFTGKNFRVP